MKMPKHDYGPIMGSKEDAVKKEYGHRMDVMRANHAKQVKELREELEQVSAERDAAVNQLRGYCPSCKNYTENHGGGPCSSCGYEHSLFATGTVKDNWEWKGPQKEE